MPGLNGNLGDVHWKDFDPVETYYDMLRQGVDLPRRRWIVKPQWEPCKVPGMEPAQQFYECHVLPRQWQQMVDLWTKLQCGTYFVKRPNWIEPPITARCLDLRTEVPVALNPVDTTLITYTVPDRFVGTILGFGHDLNNPAAWGSVTWNIKVNGFPIPCYQDFLTQIGEFINPTLFPNPQKLKHQDRVEVTARTALAGITAFARVYGFTFPTKTVTQDGSFKEYHTL